MIFLDDTGVCVAGGFGQAAVRAARGRRRRPGFSRAGAGRPGRGRRRRFRAGGIDAVADAGPALSAALEPAEALARWIHRFTELLATKRGLASALHSGDPAFAGLPGYFLQRLGPTLAALLDAAVADGTVRDDISAEDLLHAITQLSQPVPGRGPEHNQHIVAVLIDGLRCGATRQPPAHRVS